ncbi:MAG: hypothetical protein HY316_06945 [Acidobacteria bacterium]|nr:hypothetical protein [Acidobacteriota bacterium]
MELAAAVEVPALRLGIIHERGNGMKGILCNIRKAMGSLLGAGKRAAYVVLVMLSVSGAGYAAALPGTGLAAEEVLARMEERFQQQLGALETYHDQRRYSIAHRLLGDGTYWVVEERFSAPDEKRFEVLERGGSGTVQKRVFARLLDVEQETARDAVRPHVDLSRNNYAFTYKGYDAERGAYMFEAAPRGSNDYLLRGTIWINGEDFAVQRIEGEPAKQHSIFIKRVRFVHEFAKFGEFWFPVHHRSETELRLFGKATLEIDYSDYEWQARDPDRAGERTGTRSSRCAAAEPPPRCLPPVPTLSHDRGSGGKEGLPGGM